MTYQKKLSLASPDRSIWYILINKEVRAKMSNDNTFLPDAIELNFREICIENIAPKTLFCSSHAIRKEEEQEKAFALLAGLLRKYVC